MYSLPALLQRISKIKTRRNGLDLQRSIHIADRVCELRVFRLWFFPHHCLKRSLVLYRELTRMCCPAMIHFGVQRQGRGISGHSWVTLHGVPVGEHIAITSFSNLYSYPDKNRTEEGEIHGR